MPPPRPWAGIGSSTWPGARPAWRPRPDAKSSCSDPTALVRHTFPDAAKTLSALAWHPSRPVLAAAAFGAVRLWDAAKLALEKDFPYANGIQALTWSPDGKWLVSGNQDPSVHLWLPAEDTELQMSGYESKVKHLAFDHTSRWLATSGGLNASVWDCLGNGPEGRAPEMLEHAGAGLRAPLPERPRPARHRLDRRDGQSLEPGAPAAPARHGEDAGGRGAPGLVARRPPPRDRLRARRRLRAEVRGLWIASPGLPS